MEHLAVDNSANGKTSSNGTTTKNNNNALLTTLFLQSTAALMPAPLDKSETIALIGQPNGGRCRPALPSDPGTLRWQAPEERQRSMNEARKHKSKVKGGNGGKKIWVEKKIFFLYDK